MNWLYLITYWSYHTTGLIINVDGLAYLLKALEIAKGNFTPMTTHAIGWPLITAPLFYFFGSNSLFVNMVYAQLLNASLGILALLPVYWLARQFLDKNYSLLAVGLTGVSFWWAFSSFGFFAEPIFTIFLLLTLFFLTKSQTNGLRSILLASALASLAYWTKPQGILLLAVAVLIIFFYHKPRFSAYALAAVAVFFIIAAPMLYQRYLYFGSPFYYGENSKYFVDTYEQLWGAAFPDVSFWEYLKTHSITDYLNRFLVYGLGSLIFSLLAITLPYNLFAAWAVANNFKKYLPLILTTAVWLIALTPIYAVYFTPRHLFPLIPLIAILSSGGLSELNIKNKWVMNLVVIGTALALSIAGIIYPQYYFIKKRPYAMVKFSRWAAQNLRGKIAVGLGGDFIMSNLPDAIVGGRGLFNIKAPDTGIELVYPGYFENPVKLKQWLKKNNVNYLILDRDYEPRIRNPLKIYRGKKLPAGFQLIFSDFDSSSSWQVEVYKVN